MSKYKYIPLGDNVEEMFIGPFGSSLKNECFVDEDEAYCMVYEQKHAIQKTMDVDTRYVNEQKYNELKRFNVHGGDIIVSCRGTIGETFIVPDDAPIGIMHPSIMKIRLKEGVYDKYYFNLLLKSRLKKHEAEANGSGIKMAISATELGKELFPVPTMEEQLEITDIISRISSVIEKRKQELSTLDNLIKARFVELFGDSIINPMGWKKCKFGEVIYYQEGPGVRNWQFRDSGIKLINIRNVVNDSLELSNTNNYLDVEEVENKYKHFLLDAGDYVMASSGVTWGKIAEVFQEHLPLCLNTSMIRIRPLDNCIINKKYIFHFIKSDGFRKQIERLITGSAQPNFGPSHLAKVDILVPDIEVQNQFAVFVEQVDKSKFEDDDLLNNEI